MHLPGLGAGIVYARIPLSADRAPTGRLLSPGSACFRGCRMALPYFSAHPGRELKMIRLNNPHTVAFEARFARIEKKESQHGSLKNCKGLKKFLPAALAFLRTAENHRFNEDVAHYLMGMKAYLPEGLAESDPPISEGVKKELYALLSTHRYTSGFLGWFGSKEPPEKTIAKLEALNAHLNASGILPSDPENELTVRLKTDANLLGPTKQDELLQRIQLKLTPEEKLACEFAKLTPLQSQAMVEIFRAAKVSLNINTIPRSFDDEKLVGEMTKLGKGVFNTVYAALYKGTDGGPATQYVFKPEGYTCGLGAELLGIDADKPQFGLRNVAAYKLSDRLGFGVIPKTEFAVHRGKLGIVMEHVPGKPAGNGWHIMDVTGTELGNKLLKKKEALANRDSESYKSQLKVLGLHSIFFPSADTVEVIYSKPRQHTVKLYADMEVQWKLNRLQWLDVLTAQSDRHDGNIIGDGNGIDNDQTFGPEIFNIAALISKMGALRCVIGGLPEVASRETCESFMKLKDEDIEKAMLGLPAKEIDATKARLDEIRRHLQKLEQEGKILALTKEDLITSREGLVISSYAERAYRKFTEKPF
jgi:hypothetical protein